MENPEKSPNYLTVVLGKRSEELANGLSQMPPEEWPGLIQATLKKTALESWRNGLSTGRNRASKKSDEEIAA